MVPILYSPFDRTFTSNGVGRLTDCISCSVTEERNGIFECEFVYPITGKWYETLRDSGGVIGCIHDDNHDIQPFEIYRHSDPIDGNVTFNAHHISYNLNNVIVKPFHADTCADALDGMAANAITENRFSFWTDKTTSGSFDLIHPANIRELLAGQQGSILDVYGKGEYEFDKYTVKLYTNRGQDRGVTIRYGKNLADFTRTLDESSTYNAIAPYWIGTEGEVVTLPEGYVVNAASSTREYPWEKEIGGAIMTDENGTEIYFRPFILKAVPMDFSQQFQEEPTVEELRNAAMSYLSNNQPWIPNDNITINFVQLWQSPEYANVAALQRVSLCDTVSIFYPELGVTDASAKIIRIVYNVLTEQYDEMELGDAKTNLAQAISQPLEMYVTNAIDNQKDFIANAIEHASEMITGGLGGYVVMNLNASGQPQEILIMDTDDISTAVNVIRMNKNGIGFSNNGYAGPFTSAWTIDGAFNADFITTGTMMANRIYGGTLTIGGQNNQSGVIVVRNSSNAEVGRWNNSGITLPLSSSPNDYASFDTGGFRLYMHDSGYIGSTLYQIYSGITEPYAPANSSRKVFGLLGNYTESNISWDFSLKPDEFSMVRYVSNNAQQAIHLSVWEGFKIEDYDQNRFMRFPAYPSADNLILSGGLMIYGSKSRCVTTDEYSDRLLYCYETPTPMFGDIGEGVIDETGLCYIFLDSVFAETISTNQYQVFLQKYGDGDCWIAERKSGYFVVQGTVGLRFGWELKAKQRDYDQLRLEKKEEPFIPLTPDFGLQAAEYISNLEEGRQEA